MAVVELVVRARAVVADLRFAVSAAVAQRASRLRPSSGLRRMKSASRSVADRRTLTWAELAVGLSVTYHSPFSGCFVFR